MTPGPDEIAEFCDLGTEPDLGLLERLHRDVLVPSFSVDELDSVEVMARGLRGGGPTQVLALAALGRDGSALGVVVGEVYNREHVLLLAYLAVRPGLRGRGIGTALLANAGAAWYANSDVRLAVGEAHDPRRWPQVEGEDALSRLRFYGRFGARVLDLPFVQPALGSGRARIGGFLLLVFHVDPSVEVPCDGATCVRADLVGRFVRHYYEAEEDVHPPYDDQLARLLGFIDARTAISLLPIEQYDRVTSI